MSKPNVFIAALRASLASRPLSLAIDLAEAFASQPNLPAWLLSLDELSPERRGELLRAAAHVLRTELADRDCAALLTRLADDVAMLRVVISALRSMGAQSPADRGSVRVSGRNTVQLYSLSESGRKVAAP